MSRGPIFEIEFMVKYVRIHQLVDFNPLLYEKDKIVFEEVTVNIVVLVLYHMLYDYVGSPDLVIFQRCVYC
jgi:hypothetical protein